MNSTRTVLKEKIMESVSAILPVTVIVLFMCFTAAPVPTDMLAAFAIGAFMLVVGMGLFTLGADVAMTPIGEYVGSSMTKSKKLWVVISISLFVGFMITVSEPDLQVLANQVPNIPNIVLILAVAAGVGVFLVVAMLRILFRIRLSYILIASYIAVFGIAAFVPDAFIAVSFDSGGVTTGPMTVPFIMALGVGVAAIRSDADAVNDSFGLVALCSIGPITTVLILGLIYQPQEGAYTTAVITEAADSRQLCAMFIKMIPYYAEEVAVSLGPIAVFFYVYQFIAGRQSRDKLIRISAGIVYTYLGLVIFLTGVNVGFMPLGSYLGGTIGAFGGGWKYVIIPVGAVIGYFIVAAEPAVQVLTKQVEEITSGMISPRALSTTLSIGVGVSVGLAMLRVVTGISVLWMLIPGYAVALILCFFVKPIFTAIAFDSGGVASGPMTATFLLPFAMGACEAVGGNVITDAFGIVAMVAMTPLIAIQILGIIYDRRLKQLKKLEPEEQKQEDVSEDDIIEL